LVGSYIYLELTALIIMCTMRCVLGGFLMAIATRALPLCQPGYTRYGPHQHVRSNRLEAGWLVHHQVYIEICLHFVRLCGYMWRSDVVEVLGGSRESQRFIYHSSSTKLTRALPPISYITHRQQSSRVRYHQFHTFCGFGSFQCAGIRYGQCSVRTIGCV
jgi:hypothetical protein